jgi:hypothetical protein
MPVKRRIGKAFAHRITPEVIEAYQDGDFLRLHRALGLKPWERSPLPQSVTPQSVGEEPPGPNASAWDASWWQAKAIQELILAEIEAAHG